MGGRSYTNYDLISDRSGTNGTSTYSPEHGYIDVSTHFYTAALTVNASGPGSVSVYTLEGLPICKDKARCVVEVDTETTVSVIATPDPLGRFEGWSGVCAGTSGMECDFTLSDGPHLATAQFESTLVEELAANIIEYAETNQRGNTQSYYDFQANFWVYDVGIEQEVLDEAWIMAFGSFPSE